MSGVKSKSVTKVNHHGRYSFKSPKNVVIRRVMASTKMNMAMKTIPHLIGKHPKHEALPTLSWEHAHKQQQHAVKLYTSGSVISEGSFTFSANGLVLIRFVFSSGLVLSFGGFVTTLSLFASSWSPLSFGLLSTFSSLFSTTGTLFWS